MRRSGIDVGYFIRRIKQNWISVLASTCLGILIAFYLIYTLPPAYKVTASVKVNDETTGDIVENLFDGVQLVEVKKNSANEAVILKSFDLIKKSIQKLNFKTRYFYQSGLKIHELFENPPFTIHLDTTQNQIINTPILVEFINATTYVLTIEDEDVEIYNYLTNKPGASLQILTISDTLQVGDQYATPYATFSLVKNYDFEMQTKFHFVLENVDALTEEYREKLTVEPIDKDASILELKMVSTTPDKEIAFINQLIKLYIQRNVESKNKIAEGLITFIDRQLSDIADSLRTAEIALQHFKSTHLGSNLNNESSIYDELKSLDKQKSEEQIKFKYYEYLIGYISRSDNMNEVIAPSVMGMQDQTLNSLINTLAQYTAEKTALNYSAKVKNPKYTILQKNIENTKLAILENVSNIRISSQIKLNDIQKRISEIQREIALIPEAERTLVNAQRKFDFNDNVYNYYLQKKGEAAILQESNAASEVIVDHARIASSEPVSPNKKIILVVLLGVGAIVPIGFIFTRDILSGKVLQKEDVFKEGNPYFPIIEEIPGNGRYKTKNGMAGKRCMESFRSLRMKIEELSPHGVIGFTSLLRGDGKSFCAFNLARSLAQSGKKVLLVDFTDFSGPFSNHDRSIDFSCQYMGVQIKIERSEIQNIHFLILGDGDQATYDEIINKKSIAELLSRFSSSYDYLLIDCPGIQESASFLAVKDLAEINLVVVRKNYTSNDLSKLNGILSGKEAAKFFYLYNCSEN